MKMHIIEFRKNSPKTKRQLTEAHKKKISDSLKQKKSRKFSIDRNLSRAATIAGILQTGAFTYDRFTRTQNRLNTDRIRTTIQKANSRSNQARTALQGINTLRHYL